MSAEGMTREWGEGPDGDKDVLAYINNTPLLLSLLYDLDLLPEQHPDYESPAWDKIFTITNHWREAALAHEQAGKDVKPQWDGRIRFDTDCTVNGVPMKAGTSIGPFEKSKIIDAIPPAPSALARPETQELICERCKGSGETTAMTHGLGPDDYEVDISCPACNGTGVAPETQEEREGFYEKLWKDFVSLQRGDATGICERVERYYRERAETQEAPQPVAPDAELVKHLRDEAVKLLAMGYESTSLDTIDILNQAARALERSSGQRWIPVDRIPRLIELCDAACRKAAVECDERSYEVYDAIRGELRDTLPTAPEGGAE
jgi:hypothetical protein